ncbi:MAG: hypothetical protein A3G76_16640 [Acidobacteria bacterium RIFCSPLOWO2_12_FULL_65_11]|nr:MAG: hypothetical protein A3G76_16640 [Acidobacteria bacterium RIFCSPLOWO2_12_FULL_65_11]
MNRRRLAVLAAGLLLVASISAAQLPQLRGGSRGGGRGGAIRWAQPDDFDGAFVFCRLAFETHPWGNGGNWSVDYPRADINLPFRLSELTTTSVSRDGRGDFTHVVVTADSPLIYRCPFVMMTEPGRSDFGPSEVANLRDYLLKGGFLWVDDFWGTSAWQNFADQMTAILPPNQYPIADLSPDHSLFHALYNVRRVPQIPSINFWAGTGGATSEDGWDSAEPHARAISDDHNRIMVLITHNTDFGDAFEREGDNHQYFLTFAPEGYAFGINALVYAMSH